MTDKELLREKIKESGYKIAFVAQSSGLTPQAFSNKMNNKTEFRASEIQAIYKLLNLTEKERERIFFAEDVGKESKNKTA